MQPKIVIIDNNDSFTYNLVELIRQVSGIMPQVIAHDYDGEIEAKKDRKEERLQKALERGGAVLRGLCAVLPRGAIWLGVAFGLRGGGCVDQRRNGSDHHPRARR